MNEMKNDPLYQKMNTLYDKGDVKHAAVIGIQLLEKFDALALVSPSIYEVIFDNKEKKSFYIFVVTSIIDHVEGTNK